VTPDFEKSRRVNISLRSLAQKQKLARLGGSRFVQWAIESAPEPCKLLAPKRAKEKK